MQSEQFLQSLDEKINLTETSEEAGSQSAELSVYLLVTQGEQLDRVKRVSYHYSEPLTMDTWLPINGYPGYMYIHVFTSEIRTPLCNQDKQMAMGPACIGAHSIKGVPLLSMIPNCLSMYSTIAID